MQHLDEAAAYCTYRMAARPDTMPYLIPADLEEAANFYRHRTYTPSQGLDRFLSLPESSAAMDSRAAVRCVYVTGLAVVTKL